MQTLEDKSIDRNLFFYYFSFKRERGDPYIWFELLLFLANKYVNFSFNVVNVQSPLKRVVPKKLNVKKNFDVCITSF